MAIAEVFNYLSDSSEEKEIVTGKRIKDCFNFKWEDTKIICNGYFVDENHVIRDTDLIVIRRAPKGTFLTVMAVTLGLVALGFGIWGGIEAYKANQQAEKARQELERIKNITKDDVTNLPTMRGASNTIATGKTQPYLIGRNLFTPYILNGGGNNYRGFHTIDGVYGSQEFYNVVLEGGFNNQVLEKVFCDDITIKTFVGTEPQEGIVYFSENSVFASDLSFMEISQDGELFDTEILNTKIVEQSLNDLLDKHSESYNTPNYDPDEDNYKDLFYTIEQNSKGVDVIILFNGFCNYTSSGYKVNGNRNIIPSYSLDYAEILANGGDVSTATWHEFQFVQNILEPIFGTVTTNYYVDYTPNESERRLGMSTSDKEYQIRQRRGNWVYVSGAQSHDYSSSASLSFTHQQAIGSNYSTIRYYFTVSETAEIGSQDKRVLGNNFNFKTSKQCRFMAHADFDYDDVKDLSRPVTLRISSPDKKVAGETQYNDCYVNYIHSYCYDVDKSKAEGDFVDEYVIGEKERSLSTIYGFHIEATKTNQDKLKSIQVISCGMAPTFDRTLNNWKRTSRSADGFIRTPNSNPASWLLETLITDKHLPSKKDLNEIDLESLGEWWKYCDDKGFTVDYCILQGMTKSAVFDLILKCGRATMYENIYGKIAVAIDNEKTNAVAVLNEQNIINFSYDKEIKRQPDGVKVTFLDKESEYQEATFVLMYDGSNADERPADSVITSLKLDGITDYKNAVNYARYVMKSQRLRPKVAKAEIGKEGLFFSPLSKILIQHPALKIGLGSAEIKNLIVSNNQIVGLELYEPVTLEENKSYNVIIQCVGEDYCTPLAKEIESVDGRTDEIYFTQSISVNANVRPHKHDNLSYGYGVETIADPMLITEITGNENNYNLKLVDYDERIIDDSAEIPIYHSNITNPKKTIQAPTLTDIEGLETTIEASKQYTDAKVDEIVIEATALIKIETSRYIMTKTTDGEFVDNSLSFNARSYRATETPQDFSGCWEVTITKADQTTEIIYTSDRTETGKTITVPNEAEKVTIRLYNADFDIEIDKQEIQVTKDGANSVMVLLKDTFQTFKADTDGNIADVPDIVTQAICYQGTDEIDCIIDTSKMALINGNIPGLEYRSYGNTLVIHAKDGNEMLNSGRVAVPVIIEPSLFRFIYNGYADENNTIYGRYEIDEGAKTIILYFDYQKIKVLEATRENIIVNTPKYLGKLSEVPETASEEDYFLYSGENRPQYNFLTGHFYIYKNNHWYEKDETSVKEMDNVFNDMLSLVDQSDENAPVVSIVNRLVTSEAFIDKLATRLISLQNGGAFRSSNYDGTVNNGKTFDEVKDTGVPITLDKNATSGFAIDTLGNADFSSDSRFKGAIEASGFNCVLEAGTNFLITQVSGGLNDFFIRNGTQITTVENKFKLFGSGTITVSIQFRGLVSSSESRILGDRFVIKTIIPGDPGFPDIEHIWWDSYVDTIEVPTSGYFTITKSVNVNIGNNDTLIFATSNAPQGEPYFINLTETAVINALTKHENQLTRLLSTITRTTETD